MRSPSDDAEIAAERRVAGQRQRSRASSQPCAARNAGARGGRVHIGTIAPPMPPAPSAVKRARAVGLRSSASAPARRATRPAQRARAIRPSAAQSSRASSSPSSSISCGIVDAVEIDVQHRQPHLGRLIRLDDREARARRLARQPQRGEQPARDAGLARAQRPVERDDVARRARTRAPARAPSCLVAAADRRAHPRSSPRQFDRHQRPLARLADQRDRAAMRLDELLARAAGPAPARARRRARSAARAKRSNARAAASASMPGPSSDTTIRARRRVAVDVEQHAPALAASRRSRGAADARSTWRSRSASPVTRPAARAHLDREVDRLALAPAGAPSPPRRCAISSRSTVVALDRRAPLAPASGRARRRPARPAARPIRGSPRHSSSPLSLQLARIAAVQHLGEAADRGQRRAQFVAHVRDERGLDLVGRLQRLVAVAQRLLDRGGCR